MTAIFGEVVMGRLNTAGAGDVPGRRPRRTTCHTPGMRFVLVRHGQSGNNVLWSAQGSDHGRHPDTPLTPLGREQAHRLAAFVAGGGLPWRPDAVHCSLMTRAVETAAPLADALDLPLHGHAELFECGGPYDHAPGEVDGAVERVPHPGAGRGELVGLSSRLVLPDVAREHGWWDGPVEDAEEAYAGRARRALAAVREQHAEDAVVTLVTHGWFTQYLLRELLGIPAMTGWITIHNTGVSLVEDAAEPFAGSAVAVAIDWLPHVAGDRVTA
jgi:2,3-bisphosphoglycerate-dependent phosphoglycerate mutase